MPSSFRSLLAPIGVCAVAVSLLSCALDASSEVSSRSEALVDTAAPPVEAPVPLVFLGPLALDFNVNDTSPFDTSPYTLHFAQASGYNQTSAPLYTDPVPPFSASEAWRNHVIATPHTTWPTFASHLDARLADAHDHGDQLDGGDLGELATVLEAIGSFAPSGFDVRGGTETTSFFGYPKLIARWCDSDWAQPQPALPEVPEQFYQYPDPYYADGTRQRGARLYCAAKRARTEQHTTQQSSMGAVQLFETPIFDTSIRWLRSESLVKLFNPTRSPTDADHGSQAFAVPMTLGLVLEPTSLLPPLAELMLPATLVSGESELRTPSNQRPVHVGQYCLPDLSCYPAYTTMWSQMYQTVTHGDAIETTWLGPSRGSPPGFNATVPLAAIGPFLLNLTLGFDFELGRPVPRSDRLLYDYYPGALTRANDSSTYDSITFFDGPWRLRRADWLLQDSPTQRVPVYFPWPALTHLRALQNDDHVLDIESNVHLWGDLALTTIGSIGALGVSVTPTVNGGLDVQWNHHFRLRDALRAESGSPIPAPVGSFTVAPYTDASITFTGVTLTLAFRIDVVFTTIDFTISIPIIEPIGVWGWNSDAPAAYGEGNRLRIGYDGGGDVRNQPYVNSHLPSGETYPAFATETVEECLADPPVTYDPPARCIPDTTPSPTPSGAICLFVDPRETFFPTDLPTDVCSNISGYMSTMVATEPIRVCVAQSLEFFCHEVSEQQEWQSHQVVARVTEQSVAFWSRFKQVASQCVDAFVPSHDPVQADVFAQSFFGAAACAPATGHLYDVNALTPDTTPSPAPSSCE